MITNIRLCLYHNRVWLLCKRYDIKYRFSGKISYFAKKKKKKMKLYINMKVYYFDKYDNLNGISYYTQDNQYDYYIDMIII